MSVSAHAEFDTLSALSFVEKALLHDCPPSGDVEQARDFLIDVPSPQRARHGDDVLARVVGDEKSGDGAEQLCGSGDGAEFKVRDFSGEGDVARAVEQAAVVAARAMAGLHGGRPRRRFQP